MQPTLAPATAPDPPAPPSALGQRDATAGAAPRTAQELAGLHRQRDELTQQLVATHSRRHELVREMESTDPGARGVLKEQMAQLDFRVLMLEKDMTYVDHAIASAPPSVAAEHVGVLPAFRSVVQPRGFVLIGPQGPSANVIPVLLLVVLALQFVALVGRRVRGARAATTDPLLRDTAARLARVEQAVDAIAVEIERVSEGQRFVTRLVGDEQAARAARVAATPPAPRQHRTPA